jgi:hypothetical protein
MRGPGSQKQRVKLRALLGEKLLGADDAGGELFRRYGLHARAERLELA